MSTTRPWPNWPNTTAGVPFMAVLILRPCRDENKISLWESAFTASRRLSAQISQIVHRAQACRALGTGENRPVIVSAFEHASLVAAAACRGVTEGLAGSSEPQLAFFGAASIPVVDIDDVHIQHTWQIKQSRIDRWAVG